ncbi:MAG: AAA family ATPase [Gemmatimonadetes bacterium]|nr:AAA family ATPase [Gemmatimonadota bacterium]
MTEITPPAVRLVTLGIAAIQVGDASTREILDAGKTLALLAYLDSARERRADRDELVDLLWSDKENSRGRNSLRQLIYSIRRRLGEGVLLVDEREVALGASVTSDRRALEEAIDNRDHDAIVARYAGGFLQEFAMPGARRFEEWAELERQRLRRAFVHAAEVVVRRAASVPDRGVVALARRVRDETPERESSWRLLLEAMALAGDWLGVELERAALLAHLADSASEPESATTLLLRRLQRPDVAAPAEVTGSIHPELVGRESEFARLLASWQRSRAGHRTVVRLRGVAGVGKSRLLEELRARLRARGARVITVRAFPGEREVSWSFLAELVGTLGRLPGAAGVDPGAAAELVAIEPALTAQYPAVQVRGATGSETFRRTRALHSLVDAVTQDTPLVLLMDDMHWCDDASGRAVNNALQRVSMSARLFLVMASRPTTGIPAVDGQASTLELGGLTRSAMEAAIESIARLPDEPWCPVLLDSLYASTRGSPLELVTRLRDLVDRKVLSVEAENWRLREGGLDALAHPGGPALDLIIARLPVPERRCLHLVAAAGAPSSALVLATALRVGARECERHLDALLGMGLVQSIESDWDVAHDLIAEAAIRDADDVRRLHHDLADAFLTRSELSLHAVRRAAAHARACADDGLLRRVGRMAEHLQRKQGDPRSVRRFLTEDAGLDPGDSVVGSMVRGVPWYRRQSAWTRRVLAASIALVGFGGLAGALRWQPSLALVVEPLPTNPLTPAPVVELRGLAARAGWARPESITVQRLSGPGMLSGPTSRKFIDGRAQFSELGVTEPGAYVLRFSVPGGPSLDSDTLRVEEGWGPTLRLATGRLAGRAFSADVPVVEVEPGALLTGSIGVTYRAPWTAASVMLCAGASWNEGPLSVRWTVFPLVTPAMDLERRVSLDSAGLHAPETPGEHHIVLAMNAEPDCDRILSSTNWEVGPAVWDDGNDLVPAVISKIEEARQQGYVTLPVLRNTREHGPRSPAPTPVGVAVVTVRVIKP